MSDVRVHGWDYDLCSCVVNFGLVCGYWYGQEQEEEEKTKKAKAEQERKRKEEEEAKLEKERQAHAKRVAAENKRTRRFALGGFGGGRSKTSRLKMGNSRGVVVKAFAADSDDDDGDSDDVSWDVMVVPAGGGYPFTISFMGWVFSSCLPCPFRVE